MTAPNLLKQLRANLAHGALLRPEAADLILRGIDLHEEQGVPLETALGLRRHGGVSPARAGALAGRDRMLISLWHTDPNWSDLPPVAAARVMSTSARRYEANRWPRERHALSAPSAEPAATWWRILEAGLPIPGSKRLQQILDAEIQDAF